MQSANFDINRDLICQPVSGGNPQINSHSFHPVDITPKTGSFVLLTPNRTSFMGPIAIQVVGVLKNSVLSIRIETRIPYDPLVFTCIYI